MNAQPKKKSIPIWWIPVAAILLGSGVGAATAVLDYRVPEMQLPSHEGGKTASPQTSLDEAKPRAIVQGGTEYDFGMMARNEERTHSFQIRNIGSGPLTLSVLNTTCKCTVGSLEKESIESGETVDVTLTWEAKSYDREFRQSATIETNDKNSREIVLSVFGKVVQLAMPDLPLIQFNRVSRSEPKTFSTKIYGYRDEDLLITSHEFFDESLAEFFDVEFSPLPKEEWDDPTAKSALLCTVNISSGLPIGEVKQSIRMLTNKDDIPPMDITIDMNVVSDISVIGAKFRSTKNLLLLGQLSGDVDNKHDLYLIVKGRHKQVVDFSLASADPEGVLSAEFGEPIDMKKTVDSEETVIARRIPMTVIIKKGSAGTQRLGNSQGEYGVMTLNTNHPEIPTFDIKVRFSVK